MIDFVCLHINNYICVIMFVYKSLRVVEVIIQYGHQFLTCSKRCNLHFEKDITPLSIILFVRKPSTTLKEITKFPQSISYKSFY